MRKFYKVFRLYLIFGIMTALLFPGLLSAADRLYFSAIVADNSYTGKREVFLEWGPFEGEIPKDIKSFQIYRKTAPGGFVPLATINNVLYNSSQINTLFSQTEALLFKQELIESLNSSQQGQGNPPVDETNYADVLLSLLNPASPSYDSMTRMLLVRMNPFVAICAAMAYIDKTVDTAKTYEYILTAKLLDDTETKPIGRTTLNAGTLTILPAPANFRQVLVAGCSEIRQGLDDRRIHFAWDIPVEPDKMSLNILTYGYDIYRSDINLGVVNLRSGIPASLVKINDIPIFVSGNPPPEGPDSFLAIDEGDIFEREYLRRGDIFYYYLVARDISGRYSESAGPLAAHVPDRQPPLMPWGIHTEREEVLNVSYTTPMLSLLWDQINPENYLNTYGRNRVVCPESTSTQICYVPSGKDCSVDIPRCVDLSVKRYLIYRFASPEEASLWGSDRDGDLWPDLKEDPNNIGVVDPGETDPCDKLSHPPGLPPELVAIITHNDPTHTRTLPSGKKVQYFRDPFIKDDNKVYWYRIQSEDFSNNRSALSPPVRAVLFDRTQPNVDAGIWAWECIYNAYFLGIEKCKEEYKPESIITMIDKTEDAREYALYMKCGYDIQKLTLLKRGPIRKRAYIFPGDIRDCKIASRCTIIVRFYGEKMEFLAEASIFVTDLCEPIGCVILDKTCRYVPVRPGQVHSPDDPIQVIVTLKPDECARIYHLIGGNYSPFRVFCADPLYDCGDSDPNTYCFDLIPPIDGCLGIRVFSANHVGSGMYRFPCLSMELGKPDPPLIENVECDCATNKLQVRWASQAYGLVAFIISRQSGSKLIYEAVTNLKPDPATGQYEHTIFLDANDLNIKWCLKVRALNEALEMSEWSSERCQMCCEPVSPPQLPWPPVSEPPTAPQATAFYLQGTNVLAIVLSDDITYDLTTYWSRKCEYIDVPECNEKLDCFSQRPVRFYCTGLCNFLKRSNQMRQFFVYRQEEDKDFVQVSPLIEGFYCDINVSSGAEELRDPYCFLAKLLSGSVAGVKPETALELVNTTRLLFLDKYPFKANTTVRYKIIRISVSDNKIIDTLFTKWGGVH